MNKLVEWLVSQDRAVANAREAAIDLCRQRVERREVELYLAQRSDPMADQVGSPVLPARRTAAGR